jgi:hypothetical protein
MLIKALAKTGFNPGLSTGIPYLCALFYNYDKCK